MKKRWFWLLTVAFVTALVVTLGMSATVLATTADDFMETCLEAGGEAMEIEDPDNAGVSTVSCSWEKEDGSEAVIECGALMGNIGDCTVTPTPERPAQLVLPIPFPLLRDQKDFRTKTPLPPPGIDTSPGKSAPAVTSTPELPPVSPQAPPAPPPPKPKPEIDRRPPPQPIIP